MNCIEGFELVEDVTDPDGVTRIIQVTNVNITRGMFADVN